MLIKISLFVTLSLYAVVVSQSVFYILALSNTMRNMQVAAYIESTKLLDKNLRSSSSTIYYFALTASILLTSFSITNPSGILFSCSVIALISLIIDITLTLRGTVPLNNVINTWTVSDHPSNWQEYRAKWFRYYQGRQVANITGFISLLAGLVLSI